MDSKIHVTSDSIKQKEVTKARRNISQSEKEGLGGSNNVTDSNVVNTIE